MNAFAIPSTFTINVVIDLANVEAVLTRVLRSFLQMPDDDTPESLPAPASAPAPHAPDVASAPGPSTVPAVERPRRTRRTKAEIAAAREAERLTAETVPVPPTAVSAAPPAPAVATLVAPQLTLVPPAASFDPFAAPPVPVAPAITGNATDAQIDTFKKFIVEKFIPHAKGGQMEYTRIRGELGNPLMAAGSAVSLDLMRKWATKLAAQIEVPLSDVGVAFPA